MTNIIEHALEIFQTFSELKVQKLLDNPKGARLIFPAIHAYHGGAYYTCIAKNFYGKAKKLFYLKVKPQEDISKFPYGLVIGFPLTILFVGGLLILYLLKRLALKLVIKLVYVNNILWGNAT